MKRIILVSAFLLLTFACKQNITEDTATVLINEVSAKNDFIELFNPSSSVKDISGWTFHKNNETIFTVTREVTIPAGGYAVLGCKGNSTVYPGVYLGKCDAGISGKKSILLEIKDKLGERVDYFVNSAEQTPRAADYWDAYPEQKFEVAGRYKDGEEGWFMLLGNTPGKSNAGSAKGGAFANTVVDFLAPDPNPTTLIGLKYVFDDSAIPEIMVSVSLSEWNRLLSLYDKNKDTPEYVECDVRFIKNKDTTSITKSGLRLRGNTSRRRPETSTTHQKDKANWQHCHFMLNLRKYVKDEEHTIRGVRKLVLKWFKDDPSYVREMYCYDLFRRFGVWTAVNDIYCRLWIYVEGDTKPAYFGVYEMIEAVDKEYLEERNDFGDPDYNLWKCSWGADLKSTSDNKFHMDDNSGNFHTYELKENTDNFTAAKSQLKDFITKLNTLQGDAFYNWIKSVTDVNLLLRTYAVNVAVGMWDDYWNNINNYYIYFNNSGTTGYHFFFIPYDYDNTLGTSADCGVQTDSGRHNPLQWGLSDPPLISKLLKIDEFKKIYIDALKELADPANDLFDQSASAARIKAWQNKIVSYVSNDTGEDMKISDNPASWGNHPEYRLLSTGPNNFFQVKTKVINALK